MTWAGRIFTIGASIGIARIDGRSATDLFIAADLALYAKAEGRGRFRVAGEARPGGAQPYASAS
jgi:GGDEF domain-containing protein